MGTGGRKKMKSVVIQLLRRWRKEGNTNSKEEGVIELKIDRIELNNRFNVVGCEWQID